MSEITKIEWTDATWNPLRGCSRVSEGCRHCYAEGVAARFSGAGLPYEGLARRVGGEPRWTGKVVMASDDVMTQPLRWKRPRRIFVNSMSDLFHESVPDDWIDQIFAVMALSPHHTFQVLTKRPERMRAYLTASRANDAVGGHMASISDALDRQRVDHEHPGWVFNHGEAMPPLRNVWLGVSIEDQKTADERVPELLQTPSAVRFVSAEPLLGAIDLPRLAMPSDWPRCECTDHSPSINAFDASIYCEGCCEGPESMDFGRLDWVIVGGESGAKARPMHPDWARSLRDQCADDGVSFFFKQWGAWVPGEHLQRHTGTVETASYFANDWDFGTLNLSSKYAQEMHRDDEPDLYRGKSGEGPDLLDGVLHHAWPEVRA